MLTSKFFLTTLCVATLGGAGALYAGDPVRSETEIAIIYGFDGTFEDATFAVESAIVGAGLKIDYVSHAGEMLERTKEDVGATVTIFEAADIFLFCSAVTSREVMEINPLNIAFCPYSLFVTDQGGAVQVGYRTYPEGEMRAVQEMLDKIAQEAVAN